MKHLILLLVGACIVVPPASAQTRDPAAQACERRCRGADLDGPGVEPYRQKLAQIREQRKLAADPQQRKALEAEEARAAERRDAFIGRSCSYICNGK